MNNGTILNVKLREPSMAGDGDAIGLKTWGTSYLVAQSLESIGAHYFPVSVTNKGVFLELGSGTGLVGIVAATVFGRHTVLTDLPEIMENLRHNVLLNTQPGGGMISTGCSTLDWSRDDTPFSEKFEVSDDPPHKHLILMRTSSSLLILSS